MPVYSHGFQTNPCGIEAFGSIWKPNRNFLFQTNPCGIEAES